MTRVAIIDVLGEHGGMNYYTYGMAAAMAAAGMAVTVHSPSAPRSGETGFLWHRAFVGAYGKGNKILRAGKLVGNSVGAAWHDWRAGIDWVVFHIFRADALELFDLGLAKVSGRRIACIIHDVSRTDRSKAKNHMDQIVRLSDVVVVHNAYSSETLCRAVPVAAGKVSVIPHGNYIGQFPRPALAEARRALGLPADHTVLLMFGSQRREKGLDVLLAALAPFHATVNLTLLVAGKAKPEDEAHYRATAERHGVSHLVRFEFGHVTDANLPNYYCAASAVALPYLRIYESGVALMAMSFGRPIIASDIPALATVATECEGMLQFKSGDAADLSRCLAAVLDGAVDLPRRGASAYEFAARERSWAISGSKWAALLGG